MFRDHYCPGEEVAGCLYVAQPERADRDSAASSRARLVAADVRLVCTQRRSGRAAERVVDACVLRLGAAEEVGFSLAVPPAACASYRPPPRTDAAGVEEGAPGLGGEGAAETTWTLRMRLRLGAASPDARGDVSAARYPLQRPYRPNPTDAAPSPSAGGRGGEDPSLAAGRWALEVVRQRFARMTGCDGPSAPAADSAGPAPRRPRTESAASDASVQLQRVGSVPPSTVARRSATAEVGAAATPSHSSPPTPGDSMATPPRTPARDQAGRGGGGSSEHAMHARGGSVVARGPASTPSSPAAAAPVSSLRSESPPSVAGAGGDRPAVLGWTRPPPPVQPRATLPRALRSAMRRVDEVVQASRQAWATDEALGGGHTRGEQLAFSLPLSLVQPPVWAEEVRCAPPSDLAPTAWMEAAAEALDAVDATSGERNWAEHKRAILLASALEAAGDGGDDEAPIASAPALTHLDAVAVSAARRLARAGRTVEEEFVRRTPAAPCVEV